MSLATTLVWPRFPFVKKISLFLIWLAIAVLGAAALGFIGIHRGESINSLWLVTAGLCTLAISYRFYGKWLVTKVLVVDERRATPAIINNDGKDFVPTNQWIVFGHHFAAIAGPGPLVGPVLAAQFGYLPGTLWILIGATLGGGVHDALVLFASIRRGGKSLGQMLKEEISTPVGLVCLFSVLAIMVILLAVLGLVVVQALAHSPWGLFTIAMTIPLALVMGCGIRFTRIGILPVTVFGVLGLFASVYGGSFLHAHPGIEALFVHDGRWLAWAIILYGFAASVLPVWLLLAPRDYLSTFMKLGTVAVLALAIVFVAPEMHMPAITQFVDGTGLVFAGPVFPFVCITIACGAVSGFHSLIASGTTPKLVESESVIRSIGYGAMVVEMFVALMAMIAACALDPGVYFAINSPAKNTTPAAIVQKVSAAGYPVTETQMRDLAQELGEETMFGRAGGAPTFAVGMAHMFARAIPGKAGMSLWYHFAIMFEALFILTTIDAGTRVGRFILQDLLGSISGPGLQWLASSSSWTSNILTSALLVGAWGYFLYQGVIDPLGGINSLWPLFGIANQLLAVVGFCLGTTILLKMGRRRYLWITLAPLALLTAVTFSAGWYKIFSKDVRLGFLAAADSFSQKIISPDTIPKLYYNKLRLKNDINYLSVNKVLSVDNQFANIRPPSGPSSL